MRGIFPMLRRDDVAVNPRFAAGFLNARLAAFRVLKGDRCTAAVDHANGVVLQVFCRRRVCLILL
jgi:hypothetical protein